MPHANQVLTSMFICYAINASNQINGRRINIILSMATKISGQNNLIIISNWNMKIFVYFKSYLTLAGHSKFNPSFNRRTLSIYVHDISMMVSGCHMHVFDVDCHT